MKAHLAKLSLALLSTVFLLGCQEHGSEPVGPEGLGPEFAAKTCEENPNQGKCKGDDPDTGGDNPGSPFYRYTFAGDITTNPATLGGDGGSNQGNVFLHACNLPLTPIGPCAEEVLNLSNLLLVFDGAVTCFGDGAFSGVLEKWWRASLFTSNQVVNEVEARFLLDAKDKDGKDITYRLTLDGTVTDSTDFDDGIFPPEVDETMTVTFTTFSIGAQRNKEKRACSHTGFPLGNTPTSVLILGTEG